MIILIANIDYNIHTFILKNLSCRPKNSKSFFASSSLYLISGTSWFPVTTKKLFLVY